MMPFLGVVKKRGFKIVFLALEDLWLYDYHQQSYDGLTREVIDVISFLEQHQWEIIGMGELATSLE